MKPVFDCLKPDDQYFNTTNLTGHVLKERQFRAGSQTWAILEFFKLFPDKEFTPFQVQGYCEAFSHYPITSIRRAITVLTKLGYLVKTEYFRVGDYGEKNYCWRLK
jgi:hypothetical protein